MEVYGYFTLPKMEVNRLVPFLEKNLTWCNLANRCKSGGSHVFLRKSLRGDEFEGY